MQSARMNFFQMMKQIKVIKVYLETDTRMMCIKDEIYMDFKRLDSIEDSLCSSTGLVEREQTTNISFNPYTEEKFQRKNCAMN